MAERGYGASLAGAGHERMSGRLAHTVSGRAPGVGSSRSALRVIARSRTWPGRDGRRGQAAGSTAIVTRTALVLLRIGHSGSPPKFVRRIRCHAAKQLNHCVEVRLVRNAMGFGHLGVGARFRVLVTVGSSWGRAC